MRRNAAFAPLLLISLLACGGDTDATPTDAGELPLDTATPIYDAGVVRDGSDPLTWVDFSMTGCASGAGQTQAPGGSGDGGVASDAGDGDAGVADPCTGEAPLAVHFTGLADSNIEFYNWTFGDGSDPDMQPSPNHVFVLPGLYTVSLTVGGPGGTAMVTKIGVVSVTPARLSAACTDDAQCGSSMCVCDSATSCVAGLQSGLCSASCGPSTACSEGVCAQLDPAAVTSAEDWQQRLCLPACNDNDDCRAGLVCRELRRGDSDGWIKGCFPAGVLGSIGDSCVDSGGAPVHGACASGTCIGEGVRGLCSQTCTAGSCPGSAACATFVGAGLGSLCVSRCGPSQACDTDPWLSCGAPGGSGSKSFTVDEPAAAAGYCAPKSCAMPSECGTNGQCTDGFCAP